MRTELKTLKDMKIYPMGYCANPLNPGFQKGLDKATTINFYELKQEAIRWIKKKELEIEAMEGKGYGAQYFTEMMEFLNITEDDLEAKEQ